MIIEKKRKCNEMKYKFYQKVIPQNIDPVPIRSLF